jgi:hypothetical protein
MDAKKSQFNPEEFAKRTEEDYDYHAGMMDNEQSLSHFVYGNPTTIGSHRWPHEYLQEVQEALKNGHTDHHEMVQHILENSGVGDNVTVRRTGAPQRGVTNVSLLPGWKSWKAFQSNPPEKTYEWSVPRNDIIAIGSPNEGEVFVKHPRGRQFKEAQD